MPDPIWIKDLNILFQEKRLIDFVPSKDQTTEERINSIVRFSLYISIILALYYSNAKYLAISGFVLAFTYIIYRENSVEAKELEEKFNNDTLLKLNNFGNGRIEKLENEVRPDDSVKCTMPTIDNPFMNVTMKDYMNLDDNGKIIDRLPACNPDDPVIKKQIDESFNNNLYKDVSDVFGKMSSQRNYFTMPWTTIPNKQDEFARWLYLNPKTCKEDQDNCLRYEDIRSKRFIMPNPERNPITTKK